MIRRVQLLIEVRDVGDMARTIVHDENHEEILREIVAELEQHRKLKGWAIISQEGLLIEHRMPPTVNPHLLAGNAAALAHSAQVVIGQTDSGPMKTVFLDGEKKFIILIGGEHQIIFLVMAEHPADLKPLSEYLIAAANRFQSS
ncbi:MAG: roadblock/LC7 domain-containing protein [Candidatus Hermodarchaeota archaeon]|nr:roadblock/LC7 domain-containing protein [Candidatus Hermodarchaeota archaeon]